MAVLQTPKFRNIRDFRKLTHDKSKCLAKINVWTHRSVCSIHRLTLNSELSSICTAVQPMSPQCMQDPKCLICSRFANLTHESSEYQLTINFWACHLECSMHRLALNSNLTLITTGAQPITSICTEQLYVFRNFATLVSWPRPWASLHFLQWLFWDIWCWTTDPLWIEPALKTTSAETICTTRVMTK